MTAERLIVDEAMQTTKNRMDCQTSRFHIECAADAQMGGFRVEFPNFRVGRVVVHEVFARNEAGRVEPALSDDLLGLDKEAKDEFQKRVTEALSAENQSIHMVIVERGEGSFLRAGVSLLSEPDTSFAGASGMLAEKLTSSQQSRRLPGGMLIVFDGTIGADNRRVLGAIKAETQGAFTKTIKDGAATIEFLREVFLTPAVRLYKVGLIVQVPGHSLRVSDLLCNCALVHAS